LGLFYNFCVLVVSFFHFFLFTNQILRNEHAIKGKGSLLCMCVFQFWHWKAHGVGQLRMA